MIQGDDSDVPITLRLGVQSLVAKARSLPSELLHEIITLTLSPYLSDVLIDPASSRRWNAIGTLLHIDYHFRSCTIGVMNALWYGDFVDYKTGCVFFTPYTGHSNSTAIQGTLGTIPTKSNICVVLRNSHRLTPRACFPPNATCFLCART